MLVPSRPTKDKTAFTFAAALLLGLLLGGLLVGSLQSPNDESAKATADDGKTAHDPKPGTDKPNTTKSEPPQPVGDFPLLRINVATI